MRTYQKGWIQQLFLYAGKLHPKTPSPYSVFSPKLCCKYTKFRSLKKLSQWEVAYLTEVQYAILSWSCIVNSD